jgi:hypothetical protein
MMEIADSRKRIVADSSSWYTIDAVPADPKGKAFELEVYELIKAEVANGSLGLNPQNTRVFANKRYYSRDRKGYVETDVSAELWRAGATSPSIIWIWECKDLARPVEVSHVELLHAKLEQIGPDNTKGTLISRGPLSKSSQEYAKAKGIAYGRLLEKVIVNVRQNERAMWEASQSLNKDLDDILTGLWTDGSDLAVRLALSFRVFFGYLSAGVPEVGGTLSSYIAGEVAIIVASASRRS